MTIEFAVARTPDRRLLEQVAGIHRRSLGWPALGPLGKRSLKALYEAVLSDDAGILAVARRGDEVLGYVLATTDTARVPPVMMRWPHRYAWTALWALTRRRGSLARAIEDRSGGRMTDAVAAELMLIAVDPDLRSRGIGGGLLDALHRELRARHVAEYKVIVHRARADASRFYLRYGFRLSRTFSLWGLEWDLYVRSLDGDRAEPTVGAG